MLSAFVLGSTCLFNAHCNAYTCLPVFWNAAAAPLQLPPGCVVVVDEPQSLERGDLQAFLRRRIAATTVAPTAAKQKEHPNRSATQKENTEPNSDDAGRKQQQQQELEMDLLQQDIGANVSALQMLVSSLTTLASISSV